MDENEDHEPRPVEECMQRQDWPKWKEKIQVELDSLTKLELFRPITHTSSGTKPVGYKWYFV
jgi:hypothetical protein